uniref:TFIIS-type domain-containing protein n=1 Tax=Aegilops tauschii subsp. strangulata TaxID=200361 RepID=A0A453JA95_AEGTS
PTRRNPQEKKRTVICPSTCQQEEIQPRRRRHERHEVLPRVEVAGDNCVYRNIVHHEAGERTQVLQDVASDPTLPRTKDVRCAACGHGEAVFFQATARGEEGMTLFFVCCNPSCGNRWRE